MATDPITLAVVRGTLEQIGDEMDAALERMAFSPVISDGLDRARPRSVEVAIFEIPQQIGHVEGVDPVEGRAAGRCGSGAIPKAEVHSQLGISALVVEKADPSHIKLQTKSIVCTKKAEH